LARRANVIKSERASSQGTVLVLDAGNTLTGRWLTQQSKGAVMVEAMSVMGYDAMVMGQVDMSLGLEELKKREAEAKFPFLSANIVSTANQEALFKPYTILERDGKRFGIVGISDLQATQAPGVADKATVLDPVQTAKDVVSELRPQVDLLIVLSRLGLDEDKALAGAVAGIDIIVGGNSRKLMPQPERVGDTLIIQQGYLGEWLGLLSVSYSKGQPTPMEVQVIPLTPEFPDDSEVAAVLRRYAQLYPTPTAIPTK